LVCENGPKVGRGGKVSTENTTTGVNRDHELLKKSKGAKASTQTGQIQGLLRS